MSGGYHATRDAEGILTIHRVPIFVECVRGEFTADAAWIEAAVSRAKSAEAEGYMPPLHIRHHGEESDHVRAAGYFRVLGTERITFRGEGRMAVMADLVITDPMVQADVLAKRLPYRSVEIFNVERPSIDSLALLDHEAPYLELPMLMVGAIDDRSVEGRTANPVAYARVSQRWSDLPSPQVGGLVACFRHGTGAHLLFTDEPMTTKKKGAKSAHMAGDNPVPPVAEAPAAAPEGSEEDTGGEDGKVSKAAMVKVLKALLAMFSDDEEEKPPEAPEAPQFDGNTPTPANVPGAAMKKTPDGVMNVEMAKLAGEVEAMRAKLSERDNTDLRGRDVAEAMKRLDGRPLGSDLEARLVAFHQKHGGEAFKAHVDAMVSTFAMHSSDPRSSFAGGGAAIPEIALKFQAQGSDAVNAAAAFAHEHDELSRRGMTRVTRERYVEINMARLAARN